MESLVNNKTKLKLLLGFGLGFILIFVVQFMSSRSIKSLIEDEKALMHVSQTIEQVGILKSNVSSFESKMRGFVITGNEKFLEGNETSQLKSLDNIKGLLESSEMPEDQKIRETLNRLVIRKIDFNRQIQDLYNKTNNTAAVNLIKTGTGKYLMDSINTACDLIIAQQAKEAKVYKEKNEINTSFALNADLISGIIILISIIISLVILFKDINDRIKLEGVLREEQKKVEKSILIKEQFMANMSHEIRTPLNAMLGFSSLLETTPLNEHQKDYLQAIDSAGKNLMTIINDILDFSKIEAGMLGIENVPFSLQQLMQSVYTLFFPKAQSKSLKLYLSLDPKLPELVSGDPTRLNQVLMNLIGNAIKFTSVGNIHVSCDLVECANEKVIVKISVKDTGIGIAPEQLETVFDRFTQADNATTRNFGGTGLGLSIAKKLIEMQGGEIVVKSMPQEGSEFYFTITYDMADAKEYAPTPVKKKKMSSAKGKKVLVVEDNPLNQKLAEMLLREEGIETTIAANGQLAIDCLQKHSYDVILMDIQMPVLDGYEATKKIRNDLQLKTPIIAMTANAMSGEYEKCMSSGMNDYITKPFKAETLYNTINKYLDEAVSV